MTLPRFSRAICWLAPLLVVLTCRAQSAPVITLPRITHEGGGQVCYFVLTDRFSNGDPTNDTGGYSGGPEQSGFDPSKISHYHGGDFRGLTSKLDYLKGLGVTAVWVTPPFKNKPMQSGTAGYHGYWVLDFLHIDPHLGTDAEFRAFVEAAHQRGLKVYMDIIVNHTADVIAYEGGRTDYIAKNTSPYRDARGIAFDERQYAFNGLKKPADFPTLSLERSFAYRPVVPAEEAAAKNPAWLNDPRYYHNRGNSTFRGENSLHGDFVGLDDLFTEQPAVVRGFIEIYRHWIEVYGIDGYRIDTAKHVNLEFWQAFGPAIRAAAAQAGRPDFVQFGEVSDATGDVPLLSEFSTGGLLDTTLDFGFFRAARAFVSQARSGAELGEFFAADDYYTSPTGNAQLSTTFLGNHDGGRFGYFLYRDNPQATPAQLAELVKFGHALLLLSRGQPVIYYGDEQGMVGWGGDDMLAREDMFPAQAPVFKGANLLGTTRNGADDKFDGHHPFYRAFHELVALRLSHPALSHGAMITRPTNEPELFAFSRVDREALVEYLVVFNNSRTTAVHASVPTSQLPGAQLRRLHGSGGEARDTLRVDQLQHVQVALAPLEYAVWEARQPLGVLTSPPALRLVVPTLEAGQLSVPAREVDGHTLPVRPEIRAEVTGGDGVAEVTFAFERTSRPDQYEVIGVDDAPPYRVFWRPPADLAPGDTVKFHASLNTLRGQRVSAEPVIAHVAPGATRFAVQGADVPNFTAQPPRLLALDERASVELAVQAEGTGPLTFRWYKDGVEIHGANKATLRLSGASASVAGHYQVGVTGLAGTTVNFGTTLSIQPSHP